MEVGYGKEDGIKDSCIFTYRNVKVMLPSKQTLQVMFMVEDYEAYGYCCYVTAVKHCRTNVVTARVDELEFYCPYWLASWLPVEPN